MNGMDGMDIEADTGEDTVGTEATDRQQAHDQVEATPVQRDGGRPVLGYWDFRGLAQPIRFLLVHLGINYEEQTFNSHEQWD